MGSCAIITKTRRDRTPEFQSPNFDSARCDREIEEAVEDIVLPVVPTLPLGKLDRPMNHGFSPPFQLFDHTGTKTKKR